MVSLSRIYGGVASLSESRKVLTTLVEDFRSVEHEKTSASMRRYLFEDILHYIAARCADEENLMKFVGFPGFEHHASHHRSFCRNLATMRPMAEDARAHHDVALYIEYWVGSHDERFDNELALYCGGYASRVKMSFAADLAESA